jgi:uncharacterized membrane protein (DUF373 family)
MDVNKEDRASPSPGSEKETPKDPAKRLADVFSTILDHSDLIIYGVVGIGFLVGALVALGYSFWDLGIVIITRETSLETATSFLALGLIKFISDLLLVLIIMEILSTVIHYLKEHTISLRPFLFIGIVSATRSVLSIGARLAVLNMDMATFVRSMIELGVNAAVILALGITIKLLGNLVKES